MIEDVTDALRNLLNDNAVLQGYLGGTDRVIVGWINQDTIVPCLTIYENDEQSFRRPGRSRVRDNVPSVQLDTWINPNSGSGPTTTSDLIRIANYADFLVLDPDYPVKSASGVTPPWWTRGWRRVSSPPYQIEDNSKYMHKSMTYSFEYTVQD